jgi:hypothetical protein
MARTFLVTTSGVDWPSEKLARWIQTQIQAAANEVRLTLDVQGVAEVVESKPAPKEKRAPAKGKK